MRRFSFLLLLAGAAGGAALHYCRQQAQLHQQLGQLTELLSTENNQASRDADGTVKGMAAAAEKNRNQPADLLLLRRAHSLQAHVQQLATMLQTGSEQLRRATGNKEALPLQHPGAAIGTALSAVALHRPTLARRLAAYADTLRRLALLDPNMPALQAPALEATTPVAEALADLTRLESEILACQAHALQRLSQRVGTRRGRAHPLAIATAASNVVAPGATYRAQLGLVDYFSARELNMQLACDGRPVPTGPDGTGLVRFRAPTRPGPATWTGTIHLNQYGRDTTFRVTIPYRVARR
jgi:hypothetical protein